MANRRRNARRKKQLDPRLIVVGAVVLIVAVVAVMIITRDNPDTAAEDKTIMSDFTLPNFNGERVALSDYRGQYVLVNFWASWCPPCKAEMPDLHAYYRDYKDQGFTVLAVNTNDDPVDARDFAQRNGLSFPIALDTNAAIYDRYSMYAYQEYGGTGLPTSFLIGPQGELIKVYRPGAITRADLERDVTPLLRG